MLLHAARFTGRVADDGGVLLLEEQDRTRWNQTMMVWGLYYLEQAATGEELSAFHLQAGIAACHSFADSYEATDWRKILSLYDLLIEIDESPVVALNRPSRLLRCTTGRGFAGGCRDSKQKGHQFILSAPRGSSRFPSGVGKPPASFRTSIDGA